MFEAPHVIPAADKISDGFIFYGRHINAGQFSGMKQPYQVDGIATVGFDPIATSFGDHGRSDQSTAYIFGNKVPVNLVATWSGFVYESKLDISTLYRLNQFFQCIKSAVKFAIGIEPCRWTDGRETVASLG